MEAVEIKSPVDGDEIFFKCPVCHSQLPLEEVPQFVLATNVLIYKGQLIRVGPIRLRLLQKLWEERGNVVPLEPLWEIIITNSMHKARLREEKAVSLLRVHISYIRELLRRLEMPLKIRNVHLNGYVLILCP